MRLSLHCTGASLQAACGLHDTAAAIAVLVGNSSYGRNCWAAMQEATAAHMGGCAAGNGGGSAGRQRSCQHFRASVYGGRPRARGELGAEGQELETLNVFCACSVGSGLLGICCTQ